MEKVLLVATVQSHICQFHRPLVAMLHAHGCQVHVAARNNLAEKNGLKLDFVDRVYEVPFQRSPFSPKNLKAAKILKRILAEEQYDVVHCNTPVGGVVGRLAARKTRKQGTQVFYTAHGFHFYQGAPKKNWLIWYPVEKFMCRYTDKLITITQEDYRLASAKFSTQVERIHGVGANSEKYKMLPPQECQTLRQELGYETDEQLLLCTGELLPNKNQITLIRAMKTIGQRHPQARLLLAGNGPTLPELQQEVRNLGLEGQVDFLGYRTDLERYANIADIIVSCSYREGLPMNIVEGMLLAKPVVASYNRGHRELIIEGKTGFMVPPGDEQAFANQICRLLEHSDLAEQMGQAGRERACLYADVQVQEELAVIYGWKGRLDEFAKTADGEKKSAACGAHTEGEEVQT